MSRDGRLCRENATVGCAASCHRFQRRADPLIPTGESRRCLVPYPSPSVDLATSPARRIHHGPGCRLRRLRASHPRLDRSPAQRWPRRHPAQLPRATAASARQATRLPRRGDPTPPRSPYLGRSLVAHHPAAAFPRPTLAGPQNRPALAQGCWPQPRPARTPTQRQRQPGNRAARGLADGWGRVHPPGQRPASLLAADRR